MLAICDSGGRVSSLWALGIYWVPMRCEPQAMISHDTERSVCIRAYPGEATASLYHTIGYHQPLSMLNHCYGASLKAFHITLDDFSGWKSSLRIYVGRRIVICIDHQHFED